MTWHQRYETAHRKYQQQEYPSATKDFGWLSTNFPDTRKANGLTRMIVQYLLWEGHHAERTNNMGRPVAKLAPKMNIHSGEVEMKQIGTEWLKGTGTLGKSDIKGHINNPAFRFPVPVYIEVKIGRDTQRPDQVKYEKQVTKSGALYTIVKTPEDFFEFYDWVMRMK